MLPLHKPNIAQLILAAGSSSRMGEPKQLLPWHDTTLIGHTITQSLALKNVDTYVILGANYDLIYEQIKHFPVTILKNNEWQLGMGTSIALCIKAILENKLLYDAVLISLTDQPLIDTNHLENLITSFSKGTNAIVASELEGRIGVPAIFSKTLFSTLEQLKDDFGARYIIQKHIDDVKTIAAIDKGVDIDTISQYQEAIQNST